MSYVIICTAAVVVAALTLFSGFGLGTLLMPLFALFFPVELAIAATAVVHLANNVFKIILVGRRANFRVVAMFAIPAAACAVGGALLLGAVAGLEPLVQYELGSRLCTITAVKLVIAVLIFFFAMFELVPAFDRLALDRKYVPLGGALSGFFGGLSGHQGALRTAFLIRLGMEKEVFIGTIVVSAVVVDIFRLAVYGATFVAMDISKLKAESAVWLVVAGIIAAFLGSFIGSRLLKRITMQTVKYIVGVMLIALALGLGSGIV